MFWKKKPKNKKSKREVVIDQANQAMANKREEIGDEAMADIKNAIMKKQNSALEQSKRQILSADEDKVRDNLALWLRE
jgi:hypothetical protein